MGHIIDYDVYSEKVSKSYVQEKWDKIAYGREGSGLPNKIRWLDITLNSYEEAKEYISKVDKGWYDCLAVKYKDFDISSIKAPKKLQELKDRCSRLEKEYREISNIVECKTFKSQLITCKQCNSKLNKDYMHSNKCPLCGNDIRSDTTKKRIKAKYDALLSIRQQIEEENKKLLTKQSKQINNATIRWLVKVEYHC